jgi:hypothetical protein
MRHTIATHIMRPVEYLTDRYGFRQPASAISLALCWVADLIDPIPGRRD